MKNPTVTQSFNLLLFFLSVTLLLIFCSKEEFSSNDSPIIYQVVPSEGVAGTEVTINGANFNSDPSAIEVLFEGIQADIISSSLESIKTIVPENASSGTITLLVNNHTIRWGVFKILPPDKLTITQVFPNEVFPGGRITISGNKFGTELSQVKLKIGALEVEIESHTETEIRAIVPEQANSGRITIEINNEIVESNSELTVLGPKYYYGSGCCNLNYLVRSSMDGTEVEEFEFLNAGDEFSIVALDKLNSNLYSARRENGFVHLRTLDLQGKFISEFPTGIVQLRRMAVAANSGIAFAATKWPGEEDKLYSIDRINMKNGHIQSLISSTPSFIIRMTRLALDEENEHIYFMAQGGVQDSTYWIKRIDFDGSNETTILERKGKFCQDFKAIVLDPSDNKLYFFGPNVSHSNCVLKTGLYRLDLNNPESKEELITDNLELHNSQQMYRFHSKSKSLMFNAFDKILRTSVEGDDPIVETAISSTQERISFFEISE